MGRHQTRQRHHSPQPTSPRQRLSSNNHEKDPTSHSDLDDESPCTTNKAQHLLRQLTDNTRAISDAIELNNRRALGCGCDAAGRTTGLDLAALGLVVVGLWRRARRGR